MTRRSGYSPEMKERAVRMVFDQQAQHESQWSAISSIALKIDCTRETLRTWVRRAERDAGKRCSRSPRRPITSRKRERRTQAASQRERSATSNSAARFVVYGKRTLTCMACARSGVSFAVPVPPARSRGGRAPFAQGLYEGGAMKAAGNRRDRLRAMLADLKMPGALEAVDGILAQADSGAATAGEAIEQLLDDPEMLCRESPEGCLTAIFTKRLAQSA